MNNLNKDCMYELNCLGIPCCLLKQCKCEEQYKLQKEIPTPDLPINSPSETFTSN